MQVEAQWRTTINRVPGTDIHQYCHQAINPHAASSQKTDLSHDAMIRQVLLPNLSARITQLTPQTGEIKEAKVRNSPVHRETQKRNLQVHWSSRKGLKCKFIQLVHMSSITYPIDLHSVSTWNSSKTLGAVNSIQKASKKCRRGNSSNSCEKTKFWRRRSKWKICWSSASICREATNSREVASYLILCSRKYSGSLFYSLAWRML